MPVYNYEVQILDPATESALLCGAMRYAEAVEIAIAAKIALVRDVNGKLLNGKLLNGKR